MALIRESERLYDDIVHALPGWHQTAKLASCWNEYSLEDYRQIREVDANVA